MNAYKFAYYLGICAWITFFLRRVFLIEGVAEEEGLSEDDCESPHSSIPSQSESQSSTSPTTHQSEITNLGSDISEFCGPTSDAKLKTYKMVGDNLDTNVVPREMRVDYQTRSLHYFQSYALRDRVDLSTLSSEVNAPDVSKINLESFLPSSGDEKILKNNFAVLVGRVIMKHVPFFKKFGSGLERHIQHEFSVEMAKKSEVVSYFCFYFSFK